VISTLALMAASDRGEKHPKKTEIRLRGPALQETSLKRPAELSQVE
jgi:hypothetical protein